MPITLPLRQTRIMVILLSVSIIFLLLRNNLISFHQFSNFILFLLNHLRSGIMFLGTLSCLLFSCIGTGTVDILSIYSVVLSKTSSVIYKNLSLSDNTSISFSQCWLVLLFVDYTACVSFLPTVKLLIIFCRCTTSVLFLLQDESADALPNVTTLSLAQVATQAKTWVRIEGLINW